MALKELFEDPIFRESIDAYKEAASDTLTYTTGFKPGKPGTYAICLDNRNSRFSSKSVQVSIDRQEVLFNSIHSIAVTLESVSNYYSWMFGRVLRQTLL